MARARQTVNAETTARSERWVLWFLVLEARTRRSKPAAGWRAGVWSRCGGHERVETGSGEPFFGGLDQVVATGRGAAGIRLPSMSGGSRDFPASLGR